MLGKVLFLIEALVILQSSRSESGEDGASFRNMLSRELLAGGNVVAFAPRFFSCNSSSFF